MEKAVEREEVVVNPILTGIERIVIGTIGDTECFANKIVMFNTKYNKYYDHDEIFVADVASTANTAEFDINEPVMVPFTIKNHKSKKKDGTFDGFIDTGANTPCIQTDYALEQNFPIYRLARAIVIDTAGGATEVQHATVIEILNKDHNNNEYWLKVIFYLLDEIPVNIIIDRVTMRMMGMDVFKSNKKYTHPPQHLNVLTDDDDDFFD